MLETIGETEISDDNITITVKEKIFEFEIMVNEFLLVDVPYTRDELGEEAASVLFFEETIGKNVIKQFTARGVVEDDANVFVCFDTSYNLTILGCLSILRTSISFSSFDMRTTESTSCLLISLRATSSPQVV